MISARLIELESNEIKSNHILYFNEDSNKLAVIFPGGNNSSNRPILHYTRKVLLDMNCDVLSISYENLYTRGDSNEKQLDDIITAVKNAISEVSKDKNYISNIFIARSFGNIVSNELKIKYSLDVEKNIYIAPTKDALKYFNDFPGLIITGTQDDYMPENDFKVLIEKHNKNILVFENGGHALESNDIVETIDFCKLAVTSIKAFVQK